MKREITLAIIGLIIMILGMSWDKIFEGTSWNIQFVQLLFSGVGVTMLMLGIFMIVIKTKY